MPKKINTETFIEISKKIHDNKYDYSKSLYTSAKSKIKIICPIHGEFEQEAFKHMNGTGCRKCFFEKSKYTLSKFIEKSKNIHNNKYDYSLVNYIDINTKVKIICSVHGEFEQSPKNHLSGGCVKCGASLYREQPNKLNNEKFIERSQIIYGDFYDYSLVDYINAHTKVKIICKIHGEFEQLPCNHLTSHVCPRCAIDNVKNNLENIIKKAKEIHGDKYDYSLVDYVNNRTNIKIICKIHGIFEQSTDTHLHGSGCPKCDSDSRRLGLESFIEKSKKIHGDKYDYSMSEYTINKKKIYIICPTHGKFRQLASSHLSGNGCPICSESKGERKISILLNEYGIDYEKQKTFEGCKNKRSLPFDFYLPDYNICIEYDGEQHFKPIPYWRGEEGLIKIKMNDEIKTKYCKDNGIMLFRISYKESLLNKLNIIKQFIK